MLRNIILPILLITSTYSVFCQSRLFNKVYDDLLSVNNSMGVLYDSTSGAYILYGTIIKSNGVHSLSIIKVNNFGDTIWQHDFDISQGADFTLSACISNQGKYIFCGSAKDSLNIKSDAFVSELDTNGLLNWSKRYGGAGNQSAQQIIKSFGTGYIICGYSTSDSSNLLNPYYFNVDDWGNLIWEIKLQDSLESPLYSIDRTIDSSYIFCGYIDSPSVGHHKIRLMKIDTQGNILWDKQYGSSNVLWARRVISTSDSCFIAAGYKESNGYADAYLMKTDLSGNLIWSRIWGDIFEFETFQDISEVDGKLVTIVATEDNFFEPACVFYNLNGDTLRSFKLRNDTTIQLGIGHYLYDIFALNTNQFVACGQRINNNLPEKNDAWLVVFDSLGCDNSICSSTGVNEEYAFNPNYVLYPNPTEGVINLKINGSFKSGNLSMFSVSGKLIANYVVSLNKSTFYLSSFASGFYIIKLTLDENYYQDVLLIY